MAAQAVHESRCAAPVARVFTPAELDLDDLAEAIRHLLGPEPRPPEEASNQPNDNLLSFPHRVSHVVGENEAH
jgi:hypothetical protein